MREKGWGLVLGALLVALGATVFQAVAVWRENESLRSAISSSSEHLSPEAVEHFQKLDFQKLDRHMGSFGGILKELANFHARHGARRDKQATLECASNDLIDLTLPLVCAQGRPIAMMSFKPSSADFPEGWTGDNSQDLAAITLVDGVPDDEPILPTEIGLMTGLRWFVFIFTAVAGNIPTEIGLTQVNYINVNQNRNLRGTLPSEIGLLTDLTTLTITSNQLNGTLPAEIGNLSLLRILHIWENSFTGTVPSEVGLLTSLLEIGMERNAFSGTFPVEFSQLTTLEYLKVSRNRQLKFNLVPEFFLEAQQLTRLEMQDTIWNTTMPTEIGNTTSLKYFSMSNTMLRGEIPSQLGLLALVSCNLAGNQLAGTVPSQIGRVASLQRLHLDTNDLTGTIPSQLGALTATWFYLTLLDGMSGFLPDTWSQSRVSCSGSGFSDSYCNPQPDFLDKSVFFGFVALVSVVVVLIFCAALLVVWKRNDGLIQETGVVFSLLVLFGLLLFQAGVIPMGIAAIDVESARREVGCKTASQLVANGIVIVLSAITARNYPLWKKIESELDQDSGSVSGFQLFRFVIPSVVAVSGLLGPLSYQVTAKKAKYGCEADFDEMVMLNVAVFVLVAALAVVSLLLCVSLRQMRAAFNETNMLTRSLSGLLSFGVPMLVVGLLANDALVQFLCVTLSISITTLSFIVFLYQAKFRFFVLGHSTVPNTGNKQTSSFKLSTSNPNRSETQETSGHAATNSEFQNTAELDAKWASDHEEKLL